MRWERERETNIQMMPNCARLIYEANVDKIFDQSHSFVHPGSSGAHTSTAPSKYFFTPDVKKLVEPGSPLTSNARGSVSIRLRMRSEERDCKDFVDMIGTDAQNGCTPP